jgi:hypothetical protein
LATKSLQLEKKIMGVKTTTMGVDPRLWKKVNDAIMGENAAVVLTTILNGLSMLLVQAGVADSELRARAHLAAMLVSPDTGPPGSLKAMFEEELKKLGG